MLRKSTLFAATLALLPLLAGAAENAPAPDKSAFTVFNRTPETQLRELTPDRPDQTESPYTLDAGWWQIEMDLVSYTRDHNRSGGNDLTTSAFSVANVNLKVGLTSKVDLQTIVESYTRRRVKDNLGGVHESVAGFGDITSRLKINFWGDDGGDSAFGLMPFVKWPTNQRGLGNKSVEGGLIVPYAHALPGGWDLGAMTELDVVRNDSDDGYTTAWVNTVTVGHDLIGKSGFYVELATTRAHQTDIASFNCGLTYTATKHLQFDLGASIGLTRAADDLNIFAGLTTRF